MTTEMNRTGAQPFVALELSIQIIVALRDVVGVIRRNDNEVAQQIVRSASSIAANLAEGNGRQAKDRVRFFRYAAGSAEETRIHLRVALAWGWLGAEDVSASMALIDRQLALLWRLTH